MPKSLHTHSKTQPASSRSTRHQPRRSVLVRKKTTLRRQVLPATTEQGVRQLTVRAVPTVHTIAMYHGYHWRSAHVLRLRPSSSPLPPDSARTSGFQPAEHFSYLNGISVLSLLAGLFWLGLNLARVIFRVPLPSAPALRRWPVSFQPVFLRQTIWADTVQPHEPAVRSVELQRRAVVQKSPVHLEPAEPSGASFGALSAARLASFAAIGFLLLGSLSTTAALARLPETQHMVMASAARGAADLAAAGSAAANANFTEAANHFADAAERFQEAQNSLHQIPSLLQLVASVVPTRPSLTSGQEMLRGGSALSRVGQTVAEALVFFQTHNPPLATDQPSSAAELWRHIETAAVKVLPDLEEAEQSLGRVLMADLPSPYRQPFTELRSLVPLGRSAVEQLVAVRSVVSDVLGFAAPRRYLVMFQNNNELRPSGGFMGSFAVLEVSQGSISIIKVPAGGTYDLQGSLIPRVVAPEPLQLVKARWEFQDANWWIDWPTSAQKIAWFYEQAGGESVDGVVAVDTTLIERLLQLTGPVDLPEYGLTITADNFTSEIQQEVELRYDRTMNRPKQVIADLAPSLLARLENISQRNALPLAELVVAGFSEKHLLIYRSDPVAESQLHELAWDGALATLPAGTDTLAVVHTNIAGGKTDGVIADRVQHRVTLTPDGRSLVTVNVERVHTGHRGELFTGVRNVDFLRLYVPLGSRFVQATGFTPPSPALFKVPAADLAPDQDLARISGWPARDPASGVVRYDELGRTVFAGWLMVDPQMSATVELAYELPWRWSTRSLGSRPSWLTYFSNLNSVFEYEFLWEKQPGTRQAYLEHSVVSTQPFNILRASAGVRPVANGWSFIQTLTRSVFLSVAFEVAN